MATLRAAAFILNAAVFLFVLGNLITRGPPTGKDDIIAFLLLGGAPIMSTVTLVFEKNREPNSVLRAATFILNAALIMVVAGHVPSSEVSESLLFGLFIGAPVVSTVVLILGQWGLHRRET